MTIQEIISNLVKNRCSYGDIAKHSGVSKATISRWHKGVTKPNKVLEKMAKNNLVGKKNFITAKIDDQADTIGYNFPTWDEVEKTIFIDDYYEKAISYHKRVIEALEKSRDAKKWQFTEDEKVILRNLDKKFKWIARDQDGQINIYDAKIKKTQGAGGKGIWVFEHKGNLYYVFDIFNHLFQCIQWSDEQPCEFRKFI